MQLGGADIHAVETIPGSLEALAIIDVLEELPGTKAWISFQCQDGGRLTATGETIEEAFCAIFKHRSFRFKVTPNHNNLLYSFRRIIPLIAHIYTCIVFYILIPDCCSWSKLCKSY